MPTRTTSRPRTPSAGRFGRTTPPAGRARTSLSAGRVPRSAPSSRFAKRRKPAPRSKSSQALNGLAKIIPGSVLGRAAKPSPGGGKGRMGKFALLAGAAGLAMKNRDKLPGPLGRKDTAEPLPAEPVPVTPDPLTPAATTPPRETAV
jgi:hypothetical protein